MHPECYVFNQVKLPNYKEIKPPRSSFLYNSYYIYRILSNLSKGKREANFTELPMDEMIPFSLTAANKKKWYKLFHAETTEYIPFTYFIRAGAIVLFDFLDQLNLSLKNLYHVKSSMILHDGEMIENESYQLFYTLDDAFKVKNNKLRIVIKVHTLDQNNKEIVTAKNVFLLKVTEKDIAAFDRALRRPKHDSVEFESISKIPGRINLTDPSCIKIPLKIYPKMGTQYGQISGDLNPLHTNNTLAKLVGSPKAFVQGFAIFNYIISALTVTARKKFERINITFSRPVFEDQTVTLALLNNHYEVLNKENKVLVYGDIHGKNLS